jgi:hypothetical protein
MSIPVSLHALARIGHGRPHRPGIAPMARTERRISVTMDAGPLPVVVGDRHVGLLLKTGPAFRFVAADPALRLLDGSQFFRLEQVEHAADAMKRAAGELGQQGTGPDTAR